MENVTAGFGVSQGADGARSFAEHYTKRPFVGRRDELARLDAWLDSDEPTMLLVAPAGRGKSALLWKWVQTIDDAVWVPISIRFDTARTETVTALLRARLRAVGSAPGGDWIDMARALGSAIVVLDGLDEAADEGLLDDLRELPTGVRVVVAARELVDRDANAWASTLGWTGPIMELGGLDRASIAELVGDIDPSALNEIVGIADGDPLTATLLADGARGPRGYELWWESDELDEELLAALARAVAPVPPSLLARVVDRQEDDVRQALHEARRFLVTNAAGAVSFAHPRLGYTFEERLDESGRSAIDARWYDVVSAAAAELDTLGAPGRAYVVRSRMTHAIRFGASARELAGVISRHWLAEWEVLEGGTTGFLNDVDDAWATIERELDAAWSDELCVEQLRLCAVRTALSSVERDVSARTRAAAVRVGARGQRAAVASVGAIQAAYQRNDAIVLLMPELDEHGFDLLLHALEPLRGDALPVKEIAERLLDAGLPEEARQWILEDERTRRPAIIELIDRFDDPEPFRTAVREDLERLPEDNPEWRAECFLAAANVFDEDERHAWIDRAAALVDDIGDDGLWWDSYYGQSDVRLLLADALIDAGRTDDARSWLDRVRANPVPFAEEADELSTHAVKVWAKLGEVPDDLLEEVYDRDAAQWALFAAGLAERAPTCDAISQMNGIRLTEVFELGDEQMCVVAARRAVELLDAYIAEPDAYGAAYGIYEQGSRALGLAGQYLEPSERQAVLRRAWEALRVPTRPISLVNTWQAVLGLLAATDPDARRDVAAEVMEHAKTLTVKLGSPALCDFEMWWDAFDDGHREYVKYVLAQKRLARPDDWITLLIDLGDESAARNALALVREEDVHDGFAVVSSVPELWREVADETIERFERGEFTVWPMWGVVERAPSEDAAADLARRAWAARFEDIARTGCAGDMLAVLPQAEAEEIAARLVEEDLVDFVAGGQFPPRAQQLWLQQNLEGAESVEDRAMALLQVIDMELVDDDRVEQLRTEVLDEAIGLIGTDEENLKALELLAHHLDADRAAAIADVVYERGSDWFKTNLSYRLKDLGLEDLAKWDDFQSWVDLVRARLNSAQSLDDVLAAFADQPKAKTYPWVAELIVERGLAEPWARHLATLDDPSDRLVAWSHVWDHVTPASREELLASVLQAIDEERGDQRAARWQWIDRLPLDEARDQWRKEMRALRRAKAPFVPGAYGEPLGLSVEQGAALASVVRWFTA